jgi:membrane-associated phospholipid phosphatase
MYGPSMLPSFLLLLLVCWSRVVLQRHTIPQVIGGSLASILITLLAITLGGF